MRDQNIRKLDMELVTGTAEHPAYGDPAWQAGSHSAGKLGLLCSHIKMVFLFLYQLIVCYNNHGISTMAPEDGIELPRTSGPLGPFLCVFL